jgi:hypothetical protein
MKPFEKFLSISVGLRRLSEIYLELRQYFQSQGWSEKDLEKIPYLTADLIRLSNNFQNEQKILFRQLKDIGFENVTEQEYNNYIEEIIQKINDITPLNDGDYERGNQGDEDY